MKNELFTNPLHMPLAFTDDNYAGIELDLDCLENTLSSAITPSGISALQARQYINLCAAHAKVAYLHICEGATRLANGKTNEATGKLISYLVSDFIKMNAINALSLSGEFSTSILAESGPGLLFDRGWLRKFPSSLHHTAVQFLISCRLILLHILLRPPPVICRFKIKITGRDSPDQSVVFIPQLLFYCFRRHLPSIYKTLSCSRTCKLVVRRRLRSIDQRLIFILKCHDFFLRLFYG